MNNITIEKCPLCGGSHLRTKFVCKDFFFTQEEFEICTCENCGFTLTRSFPDEAEIGRYYEAPQYVSHSDTHAGLVNKLYHVARSLMLRKKAALVKRSSGLQQGRLLDYGAGTGYFAHTMQQRGWQVTGIEKSEAARRFAQEHLKTRLVEERQLASLPAASYDVITLWHVMEHVQNLNPLWDSLHSLLKPDGILMLALPNCASADAAHYGPYWAAYDVPRHLWHFTPPTLNKFGLKHGFVLEKQIAMPLDAFYIAMLSEKYRGSKLPFVRGLLRGALCRMAALSRVSASSSIIYIFRKQSL